MPKILGKKNHTAKKSAEQRKLYEREKKRRQREKIYADPALHEKFLQSQSKNNKNRKKRGLMKRIEPKREEMNPKERKLQSREWRKSQAKYREIKKKCSKPIRTCLKTI